MEHQDWTTVILKRRPTRPTTRGLELDGNSMRLAKLADMECPESPKKRVASDSLQELIRKRIELKLNQEKADQLCHFPRHTFRGIESRRNLPSPVQQQVIQKHLGVQLKIITL